MPDSKSDFIVAILEQEPALKAFLRRFVHQPSDVDDLVQETYARLLRLGEDQCSEIRSPRRFAFKTAQNLALDWLRGRQVVPMELVTDFASLDVYKDMATVEDLVSGQQELRAVERAVARLPARCRTAFLLRKVHGYSQREISHRMSISENTVERHLVKALKRIRAHMDDAGNIGWRSNREGRKHSDISDTTSPLTAGTRKRS